MLKVQFHSKFKKDYKRIKKCGYDVNLLDEILEHLVNENPLPISRDLKYSNRWMWSIRVKIK